MTMSVLEGDGGSGVAVNWLTPGLVFTALAVLLVLGLIAALVGWRIYRRVRRSGVLERGLLTARAQALPPGPGRDISALRLKLRTALEGTDRSLKPINNDDPTARLVPVLAALKGTASRVDADLRILEAEPDRARQLDGLNRYRGEVEKLIGSAARLRETAASTNAVDRGPEVQALTERIDDEVNYLTEYQQNYRELFGTEPIDPDKPTDGDHPRA